MWNHSFTASRTRRSIALAALLVCALAAVFAVDARAAPEPTVLDSGSVEVKAQSGKDTAEAHITVLNASEGEPWSVKVTLEAPGSMRVTSVQPAEIAPGKVDRLNIQLAGLRHTTEAASGQFVLEGGPKPVTLSGTIAPAPDPLTDWPSRIIEVSLGLAALLMLGVAIGVGRLGLGLLTGPAPGPKWSFESWASHLTGVGGLLGSVVVLAVIPAVSEQVEKESLVELNILFAALAAIAPFVFQAVRRRDAKALENLEEEGWGFTWALLIACWLVLGATLGQLSTLGLTVWVITGGGTLGVALEVLLGILVLLAVYYVIATTYALASIDWKEIAMLATQKEAEAAAVAGPAAPARPGATLRRSIARHGSRVARHVEVGDDAQSHRMTIRLP
jgi:hypothetical protein